MSEKNHKKIWKILTPVILIIFISAIVGGFFIFKANKKTNKLPESVDVVSYSKKDIDINNSILRKEVSPSYIGDYKFLQVECINFPTNSDGSQLFNEEQKAQIIYNISQKTDYNQFIGYLNSQKKNQTSSEIISLSSNGHFSKVDVNNKIENGIYFGNLDQSYVYILDKNGKTEIDGEKYTHKYEISQTGYKIISDNRISTGTSKKIYLYLTDHIYSTKKPDFERLSVTYIYELIPSTNTGIPDDYLK